MGIVERKERERQQRRSDIIDAAERVFFKHGIEKATMEEVAEEAELSKGTLYLYFKSKEELHFAINMRGADILYDYFKEAIKKGKTGMDKVVSIGRAFIECTRKYPDYFKTIAHFEHKDVDSFLKDNEDFKRHRQERNPMQLFVQVIEEGIKDGSIRSDIPAPMLSHILWALTTGLLQHLSSDILKMHKYKTGGELDIDPEEYINIYFKIIKNALSNEDNKKK